MPKTGRSAHANRDRLWLIGIFAGISVSTILWAYRNLTPPAWDPADHIRTAFEYYRPLEDRNAPAFFRAFFNASRAYAPLFHLLTAGVFLAAGISNVSAIAANLLALGILLASVTWIANRLSRPGIVAALLASCYHYSGWMIHDAFLDYFLMAMVALGMASLIRAGDFQSRSHSIQFGIVAGLGMLTKQTFVFFFVLPCAFVWIRALAKDRRAIGNILIALLVIIAISAAWYVPHAKDSLAIYRTNVINARVENEAPVWSAYSLVYYSVVLVDLHTQLPLGILFILGTAYSIRHRFQKDLLIYLWILSGIASFTMLANKDPRYTLPILPAVALLSVSWVCEPMTRVRRAGVVFIALWSVASFLNSQWPLATRSLDLRFHLTGRPVHIFAGNIVRFDHSPGTNDWSIPQIVQASNQPHSRLGVVPNLRSFNPSNILMYSKTLTGDGNIAWLTTEAAISRFRSCAFVLARTNLESAEDVMPVEVSADRYLRENPEQFMPIATYVLPNSQTGVLYRVQK